LQHARKSGLEEALERRLQETQWQLRAQGMHGVAARAQQAEGATAQTELNKLKNGVQRLSRCAILTRAAHACLHA